MKTRGKILTAIVYIALLAVVSGAIAFIFMYLNNGQQNFYVQYGNQNIKGTTTIELEKNSTSIFYCKNVLGVTDEDEKVTDFTVSVDIDRSKIDDFDFKVDGKKKAFYGEIDFNSIISIGIYDGYFTVFLPEKLTLYEAVQTAFPGTLVEDIPNIDLYEKKCIKLTVYSQQEDVSVNVYIY